MIGKPPARRRRRADFARLGSSYRTSTPAQTLTIAETLAARLGISRITDVTRMDRLGLPVFISVRPRAAVLRVNAGKGTKAIEARVGAAMEAIEYAVAEPARTPWTCEVLTVGDIVRQFQSGMRWIDLVPDIGIVTDFDQPVDCVACEDVRRGGSMLLPAALVFVPYEDGNGTRQFSWTSNGLASGNSLEEATLHSLLEVLERDAVAMNKPYDRSMMVKLDELPQPFRGLAASWQALGVELAVRYVPNLLDLPCFEACLHDVSGGPVKLSGGSGLHTNSAIALARAVCEAAQSRLSHIHGGREDIMTYYTRPAVGSDSRLVAETKLVARMFDSTGAVAFDDVPTESGESCSLAEVTADLLSRMAACGLTDVFRYQFDIDLDGLKVVKVIVPRCENVEHNPRRIGPRLMQAITRHA